MNSILGDWAIPIYLVGVILLFIAIISVPIYFFIKGEVEREYGPHCRYCGKEMDVEKHPSRICDRCWEAVKLWRKCWPYDGPLGG